jgi:hypothetical protein
MIAETPKNNALGKDNKLVWHLPNDFKRFKSDLWPSYYHGQKKLLKVF